ncbi:MAG: hypothetical protein MZW92_29410 [Comamonadaceae bacterium]|nr:hypothetical protein [Comamonadaceae bacterium]
MMAGVPVHAVEQLPGAADQARRGGGDLPSRSATSATAKGPVERKVVRVVTPGHRDRHRAAGRTRDSAAAGRAPRTRSDLRAWPGSALASGELRPDRVRRARARPRWLARLQPAEILLDGGDAARAAAAARAPRTRRARPGSSTPRWARASCASSCSVADAGRLQRRRTCRSAHAAAAALLRLRRAHPAASALAARAQR